MSSPKPPFDEQQYGPVLNPDPSTGGDDSKLNSGDDIPDTLAENPGKVATKETLGSYLGNLTRENNYNISDTFVDSPVHTTPTGNDMTFTEGEVLAGTSRVQVRKGTPALTPSHQSGNPADGTTRTFVDDVLKAAENIPGGVQEHHFDRLGESDFGGNHEVPAIKPAFKRHHGIGHTLYSNIPEVPGEIKNPQGKTWAESDAPTVIQKRTSAILKNNRFHPVEGSPYIKDGGFSSATQGTLGGLHRELGKYTNQPTVEGQASPTDLMKVSELRKIGRRLMMAGTADFQMMDDSVDGAVINPLGQMGIPYVPLLPEAHELRAQYVMDKEGTTDYTHMDFLEGGNSGDATKGFADTLMAGEEGATDLLENNNKSYGHLNHPGEPFSGPLPMGMIQVAAANFVAMAAGAAVLGTIMTALAMLQPAASPDVDPKTPWNLEKGRHLKQNPWFSMFSSLCGIPELKNQKNSSGGPFSFVWRGLMAFYGINVENTGAPVAKDVLDALMNNIISAGYYATITRGVIRDVEQMSDAILAMPNSVTGAISSVIGILNAFFSSKTVTFFITLIKLGDVIVSLKSGAKKYAVDNKDTTPENRPGQSRDVKAGDGRLVWRHSVLPAAFLMPDSFRIATEQFSLPVGTGIDAYVTGFALRGGASKNKKTLVAPNSKNGYNEAGPRIKREMVEKIENQLECEYMPFYFQDIRTNEIVSFHAFLSSLSDDFSPEYSSVAGYGRVDDVKIWKKTSRSINIQFIVASTSPEDFDIMWVSLNKLLTMIYPTWSKGTSVKSGDRNFIMPMSQIPTATPLVRMRLGDMIKSNYSRFNMARLFGIGEKNAENSSFKIDSITTTASDSYDKYIKHLDRVKEIKAQINRVVQMPTGASIPFFGPISEAVDAKGNIAGFTDGWEVTLRDNTPATVAAFEDLDEDSGQRDRYQDVSLRSGWVGEIDGSPYYSGAGPLFAIAAAGADLSSSPTRPGYKVKLHDKHTAQINTERREEVAAQRENENNPELPDPPEFNGEVFLYSEKLTMTSAQIIKAAEGRTAMEGAETVGLTGSKGEGFFSPEKNVVIKSFESTAGRGLAGHITSLSFDYLESPWEMDIGSRAPQWLKVNLGFAPIHDIAPGLDSDGFNRAPVYQVGNILNASTGHDIHGRLMTRDERVTATDQSAGNNKPANIEESDD